MSEKNAATEAMSTRFLDLEKKFYDRNKERNYVEIEHRTTCICMMETWKDSLNKKWFYLNYPFNVVRICSSCWGSYWVVFLKKSFQECSFIFELRRNWRRGGEDVKKSEVTRDDGILFAPEPVPIVFLAHIEHVLCLKRWPDTAEDFGTCCNRRTKDKAVFSAGIGGQHWTNSAV